ncbi:THO complex subunit 4A-like protein, partial [Drosera capensis]
MPSNLDKTLDEIIRDNRASPSRPGGGFRRRGHGGAASSGPGPVRRSSTRRHSTPFWPDKAPNTRWEHDLYDENQPDRSTARFTPGPVRRSSTRPHSRPFWSDKVPETRWEHDLFYENRQDIRVRFVPSPVRGYSNSTNTRDHPYARPKLPNETETKLCVSNLHHGVTNRDIRDLFSEFGDLKEYSLHYDKRRRPTGTAEVIYFRRSHAVNAINTFNNQLLDGRRMKIEIVGADVTAPVDLPRPVVGSTGNPDRAPGSGHGAGDVRGCDGWEHGFGREQGRGQGRYRGEIISAEELDADLDRYQSEAMRSQL